MAEDIETKVIKAKKASIELSSVSEEVKNRALEAMAEALDRERKAILEANSKDLEYASELKKAVITSYSIHYTKLYDVVDCNYFLFHIVLDRNIDIHIRNCANYVCDRNKPY